jgi:fructose-1,6-bisphosphatase/inositol monophosphatase family enzyme
MIQACATVDLCWPTIGRGCGAILKCSLWDFAGSWPIVQKAGLNLRSLKTGEILNEIKVEYFDNEEAPWKLKDFYILSSMRNFSIIKEKIAPIF